MPNGKEILIGTDNNADILYNYPLVSKQQAKITYNDGKWTIEDCNSKYGTYVNNVSITTKELEYGDIIFIMGLKIIVMKETIVINNIPNFLKISNNSFETVGTLIQKQVEFDNPDEEAIEFYKEDDYFYRAPRFKTGIEDANIVVEAPPSIQEEDKTPV